MGVMRRLSRGSVRLEMAATAMLCSCAMLLMEGAAGKLVVCLGVLVCCDFGSQLDESSFSCGNEV